MPLKQFSANLLKGDEVMVKVMGPGKLQFRAAEGSPGVDVVTKTGKASATAGKGKGMTAAGKGMTAVGKGGTTMPMVQGTTAGQGAVGGLTKGAAGKGAVTAVGTKAGATASAKTAAATAGTIWKGTGVSLGLGLGLGAAGPIILGSVVAGLGYYFYKQYQKESSETGLDYGI
ncbi:MAG: hypothetical protein HQL72_07160 [Magnetococcales bacterium]|nr:hypothetical protein [Magnetococcales bacterium]